MSDLAFLSATELAALIRKKKLGCYELLTHYATRVERYNAQINALIAFDWDKARAQAKQADRVLGRVLRKTAQNGGRLVSELGPFFGVPMTVKESFDIEGLPTTWGLKAQSSNIARADALAVQRLKAGGAIVFGKSNVPTWLADWQSFNPVYGTTNNPWALNRTPGGSSGGAAAALAAGLTGLELGSDIGASIRNPAHYCGVYGHKPTYGIAASDGHCLPGMYAQSDIAVIGPLAQSAQDLDHALQLIAQPDPIGARAQRIVLPPKRHKRLQDYRVAVLYSHSTAEVDATVQHLMRELVSKLRHAKVTVDEAPPLPDLDEAHRIYVDLLRTATSGQVPLAKHEEMLALAGELSQNQPRSPTKTTSYVTMLAQAHDMRQREWLATNNRRHELRYQWEQFFKRFDVLLCPQAATPAFVQNQQGERWERMIPVNGKPQPSTTQLFWAGISGVFYLPATCAPIGFVQPNDESSEMANPLPVGVQIIGAQYEDRTTIGFADLMAQEFGGFTAPKNYS